MLNRSSIRLRSETEDAHLFGCSERGPQLYIRGTATTPPWVKSVRIWRNGASAAGDLADGRRSGKTSGTMAQHIAGLAFDEQGHELADLRIVVPGEQVQDNPRNVRSGGIGVFHLSLIHI